MMRNKHGEVAILNTKLLDLGIEKIFNRFPNGVSPWSKNVATANIIVLDHFGFGDNLFVIKLGTHFTQIYIGKFQYIELPVNTIQQGFRLF